MRQLNANAKEEMSNGSTKIPSERNVRGSEKQAARAAGEAFHKGKD